MIIKTIKTGDVQQFDLKDVSLTNPGASIIKFDSSTSNVNVNPTNLSNNNSIPRATTVGNAPDSNDFHVNSFGTIGVTVGGFSKAFEYAAHSVFEGHVSNDDDADAIAYFSNYHNEAYASLSVDTDFTASSSASGDANGINVNNPYGGLILPQDRKGINYLLAIENFIIKI